MFGVRTSSDRDAVAAAHRRLTAIAAQFAGTEDVRPGDRRSPDASTEHTSGDRLEDEADISGHTAESWSPGERGRHVTRVEGTVQPGRWSVSPHHVAVISLVVLVMIAVAAWLVLRSIPTSASVSVSSQRVLPSSFPAPLSASTSASAGLATTSPGSSQAASTPTGLVVVDVTGKVRHPGIVELPEGSRVDDALDAAGGARAGADTRSLNLARLLVDGEQVVVGFDVPSMGPGPPGGGTVVSSTAASIAPVDLNTATAEQLDTLPGIGPVTAQAILTWRAENGAFTSVDELLEVSGIGDVTLSDIAAYVYV